VARPGLPPPAVASDCPLPMAPAAYTPATSTAVYVAAVPLRAPKGPAQLLMSAGYSLGLWDLQHFMVLLRPDPARTQVRPLTSPTSIAPAFLLLNAGAFAMVAAWCVADGSLRFPTARPGGRFRRARGAVAERDTW
jgi:hypothetical protein